MSVRVNRFTVGWSDEALDRLVEVRAKAIQLGLRDPVSDGEAFERAAKEICLSDSQFRRLLRKLIAIAAEHAEACFGSDEGFVRRLGDRNPWGSTRLPAICFTGLSGVGKSKLLDAFVRLFAMSQTHDVPGYRGLPLVAVWQLSLEDGTGLNGLLGPILWPKEYYRPPSIGGNDLAERTEPKDQALPTLLTKARVRAWRDAVCFLFADEFQNIAKGTATARATSLLNSLLTLGPRLCFCANFSLVNGLWDGNPEDRRRLLTNHLEMLPDGKGSAEFLRHLLELKAVAPTVFTFDVAKCQEFIHDSTFGVKDYVVQLLKWAYVACRSRGGSGEVGLAELKTAYASDKFASIRESVELLWSQYVQNEKLDARFWSPFRQAGDPVWAADEAKPQDKADVVGKVVAAKRAINEYERRVNDALIEAARQPSSATAPKKAAAPPKGRANVVRLTPGKSSLNDLRRGADVLDEL